MINNNEKKWGVGVAPLKFFYQVSIIVLTDIAILLATSIFSPV